MPATPENALIPGAFLRPVAAEIAEAPAQRHRRIGFPGLLALGALAVWLGLRLALLAHVDAGELDAEGPPARLRERRLVRHRHPVLPGCAAAAPVGRAAQPLARTQMGACPALGRPVDGAGRAAVRRPGRDHLLAGIQHPLQLHRHRLPDLHHGSRRQHPRVLSGRRAAGRHRRAGDTDFMAGPAPLALRRRAALRPAARRAAVLRAAAAALQREAGRRRTDGRQRQRLRRRTVRQRPVQPGRRHAPQRARLRPLLPHPAGGARRCAAGRAGDGLRAAARACVGPRARAADDAAGALPAPAEEHRADLRRKPVGRIPRRAWQQERPDAEPRPSRRRGHDVRQGVRHRHAHGARPRSAVDRHAADPGTGRRAPARQRASRHPRRAARAPGLHQPVPVWRLRLFRQHERLFRRQRLQGRRPHRPAGRRDRLRERLGRRRRVAVRRRAARVRRRGAGPQALLRPRHDHLEPPPVHLSRRPHRHSLARRARRRGEIHRLRHRPLHRGGPRETLVRRHPVRHHRRPLRLRRRQDPSAGGQVPHPADPLRPGPAAPRHQPAHGQPDRHSADPAPRARPQGPRGFSRRLPLRPGRGSAPGAGLHQQLPGAAATTRTTC